MQLSLALHLARLLLVVALLMCGAAPSIGAGLSSRFPVATPGLAVVLGEIVDFQTPLVLSGDGPAYYSRVTIEVDRWIVGDDAQHAPRFVDAITLGAIWREGGAFVSRTGLDTSGGEHLFERPGNTVLAIAAISPANDTGQLPLEWQDQRFLGFMRHLPEGTSSMDQVVQRRTRVDLRPALHLGPRSYFDPRNIDESFEDDGRTLEQLIDEILAFYDLTKH